MDERKKKSIHSRQFVKWLIARTQYTVDIQYEIVHKFPLIGKFRCLHSPASIISNSFCLTDVKLYSLPDELCKKQCISEVCIAMSHCIARSLSWNISP